MTDKKGRDKVREWLDPQGSNFMGTGLTFREFWYKGLVERFARSWTQQDKIERQRRLGLIIELAQDLARVEQTTRFSTMWIRHGIEALIEGERQDMKIAHDALTFSDERPDIRDPHIELFAPTRAIMERALETWPEVEPGPVVLDEPEDETPPVH